ncbi:MAG: YicC family protein [Deltaproteobacteria bacterium]|nr:YicC family protein [Deltaproteobacteria bacterium]MBW2417264.1 YicC family protein [Deltaproteobacteria bacterium]
MSKDRGAAGARSMTGFGRSSFEVEGIGFDLEVRSVNHRHLDSRVRLPRLLADCEADAKARIRERLQRGKVDVTVSIAGESGEVSRLEIDHEVVDQYVHAARQLGERFGLLGTLDVSTILGMPGVTRFADAGFSEGDSGEALLEGLDRALDALDAMRLHEGTSLVADIDSRLSRIALLVDELDSRSGLVQQAVRERLAKRAAQLQQETGLVDEARLQQEVVIAADRLDICEELARLRSHVEQFRSALAEAGPEHPIGRRLDFLLQEFGREANTVGSKANDAPLAHHVVDLKTEIERIREQVQNIE